MTTTFVSVNRNVNEAMKSLLDLDTYDDFWRTISPRGMETREFRGMFITEYTHPRERVLFHTARDANPFFHFFESLWILAGREDVKFLKQFNGNIASFSDDGNVFHAPYGYRMRKHFKDSLGNESDQLEGVIDALRREPTTRRAVMSFWSPPDDLGTIGINEDFHPVVSKDIPCNDLLMFKLRDGFLDLTVACRSNDAIWGAYGANAVQFSTIQEFVALAVRAEVGTYRQISDSFHIYTNNEAWKKVKAMGPQYDPYEMLVAQPFPIMKIGGDWDWWLDQNTMFLDSTLFEKFSISHNAIDPFFKHVANPMLRSYNVYCDNSSGTKEQRIDYALEELKDCIATDWKLACEQWLRRRKRQGQP